PTHLLESMVANPTPTRAAVTLVVNASYEGAAASMLLGNATLGAQPTKCVEAMVRNASTTAPPRGLNLAAEPRRAHHKENRSASAVHLAESIRVKAIVVITRRGRMANYVTNCHPQHSTVHAFTNDGRTRRQLALNRNVQAHKLTFSKDPEKTLAKAFALLLASNEFHPRDQVVVISDTLGSGGIDAIQVRTLGE